MNKKKIFYIITVILLLVIIGVTAFLIYKNEEKKNNVPQISLIGENNITLALNETYIEKGATAFRNKKDITNNIIINGNVDTSVPGTYMVEYIAYNEKNTKSTKIERTVIVKDTTAPIITLKGNNEVTLYENATYKDEGCTAIDNIDGDITSKVVITGEVNTKKEGSYVITYTAVDSSGNISKATRKVIVKAKTKPVSTTPITNNSIKVNTTTSSKKGLPVLMYHFFYDASKGQKGADNNWMEISAFEKQMKYLSDNNFYFPTWKEVEDYIDKKIELPSKSIVITIDDGDESFIKLAIPIIEKYNVKATSFVVTSWNGDWLPKTYKSNHLDFQSHSHDMHRAGANGKGRFVNLSYKEALEDVTKSKNIIGNCKVFCYPFGHYNNTTIKVLKDAGYNLAFTTNGGRVYPGANKFALPRVRMSKGVSLQNFIKSVN